MKHALVVATKNRGKLVELRALLSNVSVEVLSVFEVLSNPPDVVEDGDTFEKNAVKKATEIARATMMLTLADDSGLEVDALSGKPGVKSARFAHPRATDAENNAALITALDELPEQERAKTLAARFRCVLALVDPFTSNGAPHVVGGTCEGSITRAPRGSGGFGYDPLFLVAGTDRTMAELPDSEKNALSHRARAMREMKRVIETVVADRDALTARVYP